MPATKERKRKLIKQRKLKPTTKGGQKIKKLLSSQIGRKSAKRLKQESIVHAQQQPPTQSTTITRTANKNQWKKSWIKNQHHLTKLNPPNPPRSQLLQQRSQQHLQQQQHYASLKHSVTSNEIKRKMSQSREERKSKEKTINTTQHSRLVRRTPQEHHRMLEKSHKLRQSLPSILPELPQFKIPSHPKTLDLQTELQRLKIAVNKMYSDIVHIKKRLNM